MGVETFLDNLFTKAASDRFKDDKNHIFEYRHYKDYSTLVGSGKCRVTNRYYSKSLDCDIITIEDIATGEHITDHQFNIMLKQVS